MMRITTTASTLGNIAVSMLERYSSVDKFWQQFAPVWGGRTAGGWGRLNSGRRDALTPKWCQINCATPLVLVVPLLHVPKGPAAQAVAEAARPLQRR